MGAGVRQSGKKGIAGRSVGEFAFLKGRRGWVRCGPCAYLDVQVELGAGHAGRRGVAGVEQRLGGVCGWVGGTGIWVSERSRGMPVGI